jgi:hypothetical protein
VYKLADFHFASNEAGASFECAVDGGPYVGCANPLDVSALPVGSHTLAARAVDDGGNKDASPATTTFALADAAPSVVPVSPSPGPEQPMPSAASPQLKLPAGSKVTTSRKGRIKLTFTCASAALSCAPVVLKLVARAGKTTVRVPIKIAGLTPGKSAAVSVKLPERLRTAIARAGKRGLKAKLEGPAALSRKITLTKARR